MLLLGNNSISKTHYEILSVKEDASYEEIRAAYKSAILTCHPDKTHNAEPSESDHPSGSQEKFINVQKAWEILSDSVTRSAYNNGLEASKHNNETAEDISLEEMTIEDVGDVLEIFYRCRCGDYYAIDSMELEEMGYTLDRVTNKQVIGCMRRGIMSGCARRSTEICLKFCIQEGFSEVPGSERTDLVAPQILHSSDAVLGNRKPLPRHGNSHVQDISSN